jgi:hypothetical protein
MDAANDLVLLKANAEGRMQNAEMGQQETTSNRDFVIHHSAFNLSFKPLPIAASRTVALGGTVATVGFPNIGLRDFLTTKHTNYTKTERQILSVSNFVCFVYFVV